MAIIQKTMILTGTHEGKTIDLNHYRFTDGKCTVREESGKMESLLKYFRTSYQVRCDGEIEVIPPVLTEGDDNGSVPVQTTDTLEEPTSNEEPSTLDGGFEADEPNPDTSANDGNGDGDSD